MRSLLHLLATRESEKTNKIIFLLIRSLNNFTFLIAIKMMKHKVELKEERNKIKEDKKFKRNEPMEQQL